MTSLEQEAEAFAESVATALGRVLPSPSSPPAGTLDDDRCSAVTSALAEIGWPAVGQDPDLLELAGPAGRQLGRHLGPLCELDTLLGGSQLAGTLYRYAGAHEHVVQLGPDGLDYLRVERSVACRYGDLIGVHRALSLVPAARLEGSEAQTRVSAWVAASVGYAAGVGEFAFELTLDYARNRRAFGATLAALAPVQQMLAQAATAVRGLRLLAMDCPAGGPALAHAGDALGSATAACHQIVGAIGFTLEFPLQRASRRARALKLWSDAALADLMDGGAQPQRALDLRGWA